VILQSFRSGKVAVLVRASRALAIGLSAGLRCIGGHRMRENVGLDDRVQTCTGL